MNEFTAAVFTLLAVVILGLSLIFSGSPAKSQGMQTHNAIQIYPDGQVKFDWKAVEQCARDPQQLYCKVAWAAHKECR